MFIFKSKAIRVAGGRPELAKKLGVTRQAIHQWPDRQPIPQKQAIKLVKLYGEDAFR